MLGWLERGNGVRLALEALARLGIVAHLFRQELQRHGAAQLQVFGAIDQPHASAADDLQHAVVRDDFAGQAPDFAAWPWEELRNHQLQVPRLHCVPLGMTQRQKAGREIVRRNLRRRSSA